MGIEFKSTKEAAGSRQGIFYGAISFIAWGLLPLYWKLLKQVPAQEILAHRIFWSFIFVSALILIKGDLGRIRTAITNRKNMLLIVIASILISVNWFTYIWAVNSDYVLQASLGYYINPLVVSILGILVFKERFDRAQIIALLLAFIGVLLLTIQYGRIPWVALILAVTFALYGMVKKLLKVDSVIGLALETMTIAPIALAFIIFREGQGVGSIGLLPISTLLFLFMSGIATATPLLWFAKGTQLVEFSTIGFLQYISPTISMLLGIFVFREAFTSVHAISFGFIWTALVIYTVSKARAMKPKETLKIEY
ncbi:MAG: EamA family transporter RarD [Flavobacteriales bacterium]|nr:EamA family transporter RarD [Flavobacteriales bacterium]